MCLITVKYPCGLSYPSTGLFLVALEGAPIDVAASALINAIEHNATATVPIIAIIIEARIYVLFR